MTSEQSKKNPEGFPDFIRGQSDVTGNDVIITILIFQGFYCCAAPGLFLVSFGGAVTGHYAHSVRLTLPFIDRSDWTWGNAQSIRGHKKSLKWRKKKNRTDPRKPSEVTVVEAAIILQVGVTNQPIPHYPVVAINDSTIYHPLFSASGKTERKKKSKAPLVCEVGSQLGQIIIRKRNDPYVPRTVIISDTEALFLSPPFKTLKP